MSKDRNVKVSIENLSTAFEIMGSHYKAVDDVTFDLYDGEMFAIVGESGCGKSALALSIMGLHDDSVKIEGSINYKEKDLNKMNKEERRKIRGFDFGMIFQEPLTALNPLVRVGEQIKEVLSIHTSLSDSEKNNKVLDLLDEVGIPNKEVVVKKYPHELSGGMRQRIVIAIALACDPDVIIADEPTTALDVTIQAQILKLIDNLRIKQNTSTILITHDLGVVAEVADRVAVMYAGQIVEMGTIDDIFDNPMHPYTISLLRSIPNSDNNNKKLYVIDGIVPSLQNIDRTGCRFSERIKGHDDSIHEENPQLREVEEGHFVRCTCYKEFDIEKSQEV